MKHERKYLTLPPDWWREIERRAADAGLSVSAYVGRQTIPASVRRDLSEPQGRGRPKSGQSQEGSIH